MLARSPKDRSRSPHRTNGAHVIPTNSSTKHSHDTSSPIDTNSSTTTNNNNNKTKKDNESQSRMKNLKSFIQILMNDASSPGSTYDEQVKGLENACMKEFQDLSLDRIRRMIRSVFKGRKSHQSPHTTNSILHQDHPTILPSTTTTERFNSNEANSKKNRSNSTSNNSSAKTPSELIPSSSSAMSALDADFLRHAFSQQFRPSMDLSAYFSAAAAATASNGTGSASSLFRPNFSPSNFLQSLTTPPPPLPTTTTSSSHSHTNGSYRRNNDSPVSNVNKLSKQVKLSNNESNSIKVLVNAYREAAAYLNRSADELELLT